MLSSSNTFRILVRKFDPFQEAIVRQWQSFQQESGVELLLVAEPLDLHPLHAAIFAPERHGDWDVAFIVSDWFAQAHAEQSVADLSPYLAEAPPEDYPAGWTRSLLDLHHFNGYVLGLPYHDGPECLIYRSDLFGDAANRARFAAQHGRELREPQTWAEFHEVARFFHRPDEGLFGTVFAAYPDGHNTVYDFCLQLWTRGGELFDDRGALHIDTPQAAEALAFYRRMLNDPMAVHPECRNLDSVKAGLAFAAGQAAMMINWFGFAGMAQTLADSMVRGKVDIANIPCNPGASTASLNAYWILSINQSSQHRDLAYRFLRHCASPAMDKLLTLGGGIGCRRSTWLDAEVNDVIPFYSRMPALHEYARSLPHLLHWTAIAAEIDRLVLAVINTDEPIGDLLAEAQRRLVDGLVTMTKTLH